MARILQMPTPELRIKERKKLDTIAGGEGFARLISENELIYLFQSAASKEAIVDSIEPFRIIDNAQIPHVELTINPNWFHETFSELPWSEKISKMEYFIEEILKKAHEIGGEFRYYAWVSKRDDWD